MLKTNSDKPLLTQGLLFDDVLTGCLKQENDDSARPTAFPFEGQKRTRKLIRRRTIKPALSRIPYQQLPLCFRGQEKRAAGFTSSTAP